MATRRYTLRDQLGALAHGARLLARHRGDLAEVQAELDQEREWARFRARHGLNNIQVTDDSSPDEAVIRGRLAEAQPPPRSSRRLTGPGSSDPGKSPPDRDSPLQ